MSKLLQRVITATVLFAVVLVVFFRLPTAAAAALLGAFVTMAAWEWGGFLRLEQPLLRAGYAFLVLALMLASIGVFPDLLSLRPLLWASLVWWVIAFFWVLRYPTPIARTAGAACGIVVLVPAYPALVTLLRAGERGPEYVLLLLGIVWAADIGAYFVGRRFGRTRLAPRVSPGKTWEGLIGGLLGAACIAAIGASALDLPIGFVVPLGVSVAAISVVGDLTVSMFKRNAGLKDSGVLFPGHGGVLDRIDSVTAAAPLFLLGISWTGLVPV